MRRPFWVEAVASGCSSLLFIVTLAWPDWIELYWGLDPDYGNGSVEWLIVVLSAVAITAVAIARMNWRRTHVAGIVGAAG